jgi:electron transfer flavoprotein alpha/beta subunit
VVYDGSPSSERALELAAAIAGGEPPSVTVILTGDFEDLRRRAAMHLAGRDAGVDFQPANADPKTLTERLRRSSAKVVLVPISVFLDPARAPAILETLNRSVFLVR